MKSYRPTVKLPGRLMILGVLAAICLSLGFLAGWLGWWTFPVIGMVGIWFWNWRLGLILSAALVMVFMGIRMW